MYEFVQRRRKLLFSAAVGAAVGAGAAYYWGGSNADESSKQDRDGSLTSGLWSLLARTQPGLHEGGGVDSDLHHESELYALHQQHQGHGQQQDGDDEQEESMDASMNEHFQFIQKVSTPQELEQLLPKLQAAVAECTDVAATLRSLPPTATAAEKLSAMAQASCARALSAVWIIPLMDLYVRAKLNIIGRHLFLQERLSRLLQPPTTHTMGVVLGGMGSPASTVPGQLPPKLDAAAVESFLGCAFFAETGVRWLVAQVVEGVSAALPGIKLEQEVSPQEVVQALGAMLVAVEERLGADVPWPDVLVGSDAVVQTTPPGNGRDTLAHSLATSAMLQELHSELRGVLVSARFRDGLRAAVQHAFRLLAAHVYAAFPDAPAPAAGTGAAAGASSGSVASSPAGTSKPAAEGGLGSEGGAGPGGSVHGSQGSSTGSQQQQQLGRANSTGLRASGSLMSLLGLGGAATSPTGSSGGAGVGPSAGPKPGAPPSRQGSSVGAAGRAPRPLKQPKALARLLKPIHATGDTMFGGTKQITKGIAELAPVMALCASIFAPPQGDHCLDH